MPLQTLRLGFCTSPSRWVSQSCGSVLVCVTCSDYKLNHQLQPPRLHGRSPSQQVLSLDIADDWSIRLDFLFSRLHPFFFFLILFSLSALHPHRWDNANSAAPGGYRRTERCESNSIQKIDCKYNYRRYEQEGLFADVVPGF